MKASEFVTEAKAVKTRLDPKCWKGKHKEGTKIKGGVRVNNCVPNESVAEGEIVSMKDDPSTIKRLARQWWTGNEQQYAHAQQMLNRMGWDIWEDEDDIVVAKDGQEYVLAMDDMEAITESEAWQKVNKKDKTAGMSKKAVSTYRREHPGSKLQTAVTTKPSKLKKGSKASKRRKSYCSRSKGQMNMHNISCAKTPDKAICKARRRWNCE